MKFVFQISVLASLLANAEGFSVVGPASTPGRGVSPAATARRAGGSSLFSSSEKSGIEVVEAEFETLSLEDKKEVVGNLVADDEWDGLSMELSETIRLAIVEDIKKNTRDFIGKADYNVGDITKEVDGRVKQEIATLRGKEDYELGDFVMAMDEVSKSLTENLTGKEYETGDLSKEIDKRVKNKVAEFAGKDDYEFGDLSKELDKRVKVRVAEFTGAGEYKFGDVSRAVEERRKDWIKDLLGAEAASKYQFGDITMKTLANISGDDDYEFGDITKKAFKNIFGGKNKK